MDRKTALQRRIDAALKKLEPSIRQAFTAAIQAQASAVDMRALVAALEVGNVEGAVALLRTNQALLFPLSEAVRDSFIVGGTMAVSGLPKTVRATFGFDGRHERAEAWVMRHAGVLIEGIREETLQMARDVIRAGIEAGHNPRKVAVDIVGRKVGDRRVGGFLGLNSRQTNSILSGRAKLLSGDPALMRKYLELKLRDRRFDRTIAKAIREGEKLSVADVDRIIAGHKSKALKYRGDVIARTESLNGLRAGRHEGFKQVEDEYGADAITRTWDATGDSRTRPEHMEMDGQTVRGMDEPFVAPDGSRLMHPGDTSLGASGAMTIQCRCIEAIRVDFMGAR